MLDSAPVLTCLCLILAGSAAREAWWLWRHAEDNRFLTTPDRIRIDAATDPELIFAAARYQDEHGDYQEALRLYGSVAAAGDPEFRKRVSYNIGTIHLREAAKLWNAVGVLEHSRVNTLIELAKERYREVLREDPGNWDARHNLEYAFRITPPPKERAKSDWRGEKTSVFATLPSLPGGGP
jgi:mxaK protein